MKKPLKQGLSFGTVFTVVLTLLVVAGSVAVLTSLNGNSGLDFSALTNDGTVDLKGLGNGFAVQDIPLKLLHAVTGKNADSEKTSAPLTERTAGSANNGAGAQAMATPAPAQQGRSATRPAENAATAEPAIPATLTLTAGGGISVEKGVRQSAYYDDSKKYDFSEILSLLKPYWTGDLCMAAGYNLVVPEKKVNELITPAEVMEMMAGAGIHTVSLGFQRALDQGADGVRSTLKAASDAGLKVTGLFAPDENGQSGQNAVTTVGGMKVAVLHYTDALSSTGKKAAKKAGNELCVPIADAEAIAADIADARKNGAECVIVTLSWGKEKAKAPTKAQKELGNAIAEAGADLILGTGAQVVQPVEMLEGKWPDGTTRHTLCAWCLGGLIDDARENNRVAGMLLHLKLSLTEKGHVNFDEMTYTPTYIWRYKQDSKYGYRVVSAVGDAPDGMDDSQLKSRTRAAETVATVLKDSPLKLSETAE